MKQELSVKEDVPERDFDLGTWLGRRQAFSMMAGKATAADVECLRTIRDRRLYKARTERWGDFCAQHVGASKAQVDRQIRYLEEFGPQFFEVTNVTRISPETYRLIAPKVTAKGIRLDDQTIPINQENSGRISAAVAELRRRLEAPRKPAPQDNASVAYHTVKYAALAIHCEDVIAAMKEVDSLSADEKSEMRALLNGVYRGAAKLGLEW